MKRLLAGVIPLIAVLMFTSAAQAHHVESAKSWATCTQVGAKFIGFGYDDGDVSWQVKVDSVVVRSGVQPKFSGDKLLIVNLPVLSAGNHLVRFDATWKTKGSNNGTFTKTVVNCPGPPPPPPTCENTPSLCPPVPPPPPPPAPPVPPVPPTCATNPELCPPPPPNPEIECIHETTGNIAIRKRGHHYWLRGKNLSRFRWRVDGKLVGKKRSTVIRSYKGKHVIEVRALLNGCQKVRRTKSLPRPKPGPPRFTG